MSKRIFPYLASSILFLLIVVVSVTILVDKPVFMKSSLLVNGKEITNENVIIHNEYVAPFLKVLNSLGADIKWLGNNNVKITLHDKKYILNFDDLTLIEEGKTANLLVIPPEIYYHFTLDDILIDSRTLLDILGRIGEQTDINAYLIHKEFAELPLTKVLNGLGATTEWIDDKNAKIVLKDRKYTLFVGDTSLPYLGGTSLMEDDKNLNLLMCPPGSTTYSCKAADKEVIVDSNTILDYMYFMGENISIDIDVSKSCVYITERND